MRSRKASFQREAIANQGAALRRLRHGQASASFTAPGPAREPRSPFADRLRPSAPGRLDCAGDDLLPLAAARPGPFARNLLAEHRDDDLALPGERAVNECLEAREDALLMPPAHAALRRLHNDRVPASEVAFGTDQVAVLVGSPPFDTALDLVRMGVAAAEPAQPKLMPAFELGPAVITNPAGFGLMPSREVTPTGCGSGVLVTPVLRLSMTRLFAQARSLEVPPFDGCGNRTECRP